MIINDTICAQACPIGGAIVIIRVSGPRTISIVNTIFSKDLENVKGNRLIYGTIYDYCEHSTSDTAKRIPIDDVIVSVFRAPHSYTGEDSIEISCHGSSYIVNTILELLIKNGCRMAHPGEYTQQAFLNGKMDLSQAEAVADLIASSSRSSHDIAIKQLRGSISTELSQLREQLLNLTSLLELELDFSDHEDLEFADRNELTALSERIISHLTKLVESFHTGNAIKNGVPVAIIGAPNVGKSTLLNCILKDDRAIVSDIQGTTRDIIEDTIILEGILFRFLDTAGIRHTDDTIENLGIQRSLRAAEKARIIILLTEPGVPYPTISVNENQTVIKITNKTQNFQAINGTGVDELCHKLVETISSTITDDTSLITNVRQYETLSKALYYMKQVKESLSVGLSGDLISSDLHQVLYHIGVITGQQFSDNEILGNIFNKFCIGK